jgi:Lysyl oxidase
MTIWGGFMTSTTRHRRGWRTAVTVTAAGGLLAAGVTAAWSAAPPPQLALVTATNAVTLERYEDEEGNGQVPLDLGTHLIAGKDPFEVRVTRKSYKDPIVAHQVVRVKGKKTNVKLPAGMVSNFAGFERFFHLTVKNAAGRTVLNQHQNYCPNGFGGSRTRRDAPEHNPYPADCPYHPFTLGSVWGIQAGWNAPTRSYDSADLPLGKYQAVLSVNKKYRDYFKIPANKSTVKINITVEPAKEGEGGPGVPPSAQRRAHDLHATQGDPNRQVAAFSPELRPASRRPAELSRAALPKGPRPDLRSLPAGGIMVGKITDEQGNSDGRFYLSFAATVWNAGPSPLVVDGFRRTGTELMDAYQYFYDAKGKQIGSVKAGTMEWDKRPGHVHWHFTDFAQYRLLRADKKVAVRSGKESFCLANTDAVDYTVRNAKWRPGNNDLATSCGQNTSVAVRQVLDVGSGDTYNQYLPGQSFDVTDLPNGTYYIEVLANPSKKLTESNTKNNSALRKIVLSGPKTDRVVTVPPHHGIDG